MHLKMRDLLARLENAGSTPVRELNRSAVMADAAPPKALPPWRGARLLERLNQVIPK
jgi:hypothetical protein